VFERHRVVTNAHQRGSVAADCQKPNDSKPPLGSLGHIIGRTRFVVLLAVIAVLLVALSLFVLGAVVAVKGVGEAWVAVFSANVESPDLTVEFLELVSVMLKAVVFYLIAVGLYSLFIAPLNLPVALGVETLNDLETKIISVVIVIMAVEFLEHFIRWEDPVETLQYGAALAVAVAALVLFQFYNHLASKVQKEDKQERSKKDMFEKDEEQHKNQAGRRFSNTGPDLVPRCVN
jgi:uncharacterized membrane protein YqhA